MTMRRSRSRAALLVTCGLAAAPLALGACSSPGTPQASGGGASSPVASAAAAGVKAGDILPFCPAQPTKAAFIKSAGGQVWSTIANAELQAEAAKCPNLNVTFYNGTSGAQGAIAATNAAVAQGDKLIVEIPDFGPSQLPSLRKAKQAGVTVVVAIDDIGGQKGTDYSDMVVWSNESIAVNQAKWLAANVKSGQVAYLGGVPGATSSNNVFDAFKTALAKYAPGMTILTGNWIPTNWDAGMKRQVMAGLLAKYGKIAAVVSDYGAADTGAVQAITAAHAPLPAFLNIGTSQAFVCLAEKDKVNWLAQDGSTRIPAEALRVGLAEMEGKASPEPRPYNLFVYADTAAGTRPPCVSSISPDADLSSSLPTSTLEQLLK
jgi:ribose transport system substrate-binding protein